MNKHEYDEHVEHLYDHVEFLLGMNKHEDLPNFCVVVVRSSLHVH